MHRRTDISVAAIVLATVCSLVGSSTGCTYSDFDRPVLKTFTVSVANGTTPIEGLQIEIESKPDKGDGKVVRKGRTGADGAITFTDLAVGRYYVIVRYPDLERSVSVKVVPQRTAETLDRVSFDWPGDVLKVRRFAGRVRAPIKTSSPVSDLAFPQWQLLSDNKLDIERPVQQPVVTITTNNAGEFDADLIPGLYLIRVAKNERFRIPEGVFAVEIDPTAPEIVLNLRLWQQCGGLEALKVDE